MALNNSASKQQYAFSKSSRFPSLKQNTKDISPSVFDKPSDFNKTKSNGYGFGSNAQRFKDHNTSMKHAVLPSPMSYTTQPRTFSPDVSKSKGWNMGLGRGDMKKIHIDKLNDEAGKKIASPCPGSYEKS